MNECVLKWYLKVINENILSLVVYVLLILLFISMIWVSIYCCYYENSLRACANMRTLHWFQSSPGVLGLICFCSSAVSGNQGDNTLHSLLSSSSSAGSYLQQQQVVVNHHHSSQSSYACARCGNSYARLHSLSRHVRFECGVDPKFECPICHKKSKHKHNLLLHMKTHLKWSSDVFRIVLLPIVLQTSAIFSFFRFRRYLMSCDCFPNELNCIPGLANVKLSVLFCTIFVCNI